jgi:hypothetical protein
VALGQPLTIENKLRALGKEAAHMEAFLQNREKPIIFARKLAAKCWRAPEGDSNCDPSPGYKNAASQDFARFLCSAEHTAVASSRHGQGDACMRDVKLGSGWEECRQLVQSDLLRPKLDLVPLESGQMLIGEKYLRRLLG